tara:strand:- start:1754 stop:4717 length:2964 start_codon:yes stop_codon:yes gene_type:complete
MANPRSIAMNKKRGLLSDNLGALTSLISDDKNDLDKLSFSTENGMSVSLNNNRNKENGPASIQVDGNSFPKLGSGSVSPRITNNFDDQLNQQEVEKPAMQPRWNGVINSKKTERDDALQNFVKTNSTPIAFKPYYLPLGDGEEYYVESVEEEDFLENSSIEERTAYMGMNEAESIEFLANRRPPKNRFGHELGFESPIPTGMNALYSEVNDDQNTLMPMLDGESFVGQDDSFVSNSDPEGLLQDNFVDMTDVDKQNKERNRIEKNKRYFEELKMIYPNQALTSKYYPDFDYTSAEFLAQIQAENDQNLGGVHTLHNPFNSTIGYEEDAESLGKYNRGSVVEKATGVNLTDEEIEEVNTRNYNKLSLMDDSIILEDIQAQKDEEARIEEERLQQIQFDSTTPDALYPEALPDKPPGPAPVIMDEEQNYAIPEIDAQIATDVADNKTDVLGGVNLSQENIDAEAVEVDVAASELDATDPTIKTTVDEVIDKSQENGDSPEETESKLSELFGGLKDIFGVDNKSLLRAFVKYVGGRVFGLSSGKAANFAWKGIEQDMATESAKGAEARKYADNMAAYGTQYDAAMAAGDTEGANRILQKMNTESGIDKSDPEKYYEGLEFLQNKKAEAISSGNADLVKGIDAQIKRWEQGGIDGTTTPTAIYDIKVQDENGNELILNARDGTNGRLVQMPNGEFVDLKDFKADGFGTITHAGQVNASGAGPTPFKMAGQRYNSETDADFEKQLDNIDAKVEAGTISEEEAFNERSMIQNSNNNRNSDGELYKKKIPYAESISDSGVAFFPPQKDAAQKSSYQLAEGARGLAKLETIQSNPKAMAMVNKWTATWQSISNTNKMSYGQLSTYIAREFTSNPLQQAYYMGMLELTTSKLRRDTGAAYNMKEMMDTMERYTNFKDSSGDVTSMKLANAKLDLEAIAGNTRSGPYWLGVLDGTYRPSNSWQNTIGSIYDMMENEGVYTSNSGNGNGSDRDFSEYD